MSRRRKAQWTGPKTPRRKFLSWDDAQVFARAMDQHIKPRIIAAQTVAELDQLSAAQADTRQKAQAIGEVFEDTGGSLGTLGQDYAAAVWSQLLIATVSVGLPLELCSHADMEMIWHSPRPLLFYCDPSVIICAECFPLHIGRIAAMPFAYEYECDRCGRHSKKMHPAMLTLGNFIINFNQCPACYAQSTSNYAREEVR